MDLEIPEFPENKDSENDGHQGGITKNEPVINGDKMKWKRSNKTVPRKQNSERLINIRPEI